MGVYAPDAEAYTVFADLFDPIIEEYHGGFSKDKQSEIQHLGISEWSKKKILIFFSCLSSIQPPALRLRQPGRLWKSGPGSKVHRLY